MEHRALPARNENITLAPPAENPRSPEDGLFEPGLEPARPPAVDFAAMQRRYAAGEWRAIVFRDAVVESVRQVDRVRPVVLDIGCGHGFDGNQRLQQSIAETGARLIGIEPDPEVAPPEFFHEVHHTSLEEAPLPRCAIDVAYSVFVLEHVVDPAAFWMAVYNALTPGGVFWGFTMDARHSFATLSSLMQKLHIKDAYLRRLHGRRGAERYENYPTTYRANSPRHIERDADFFSHRQYCSLKRVGSLDFYLPRLLRPAGRMLDRFTMCSGLPGSILVVRLQK